LTEPASSLGSLRDRLLAALADPEVADQRGHPVAALVGFHEPMAVLEWIGTGKGLVLLDHGGIEPEQLAAQIERLLGAHEQGVLFVAVAGGGSEVAEVMRAADSKARNRDHLGFYHLDDSGTLRRVAGRRLPDLEKAARDLPSRGPLSQADVEGIQERGRRERLEAMEFVRSNARRFPHVTIGYMAICVLLFALTAGNDPRAQQLFLLLANQPGPVSHGEIWRLLTYAVLHDPRNLTHLLVNMVSLYSLGSFVEPTLGRWRMAGLLAGSALAAGVASALFTQALSVGASGAVWGLVGATFGLLAGRHRIFPALIARSLRRNLVVILLLNIAISFLPGIDRYAHFGGGIAGYLIAVYFARHPRATAAS
jgi:membrane associated rhomboid family serine protease